MADIVRGVVVLAVGVMGLRPALLPAAVFALQAAAPLSALVGG